MRLGVGELLVILGILLLIFGAKRLPELGRALGQSLREFQRGARGNDDKSSDGEKPSNKDT